MPYDIQTKDGITIRNVPDNVDPNSDEIKKRVSKERQKLFTSPTVENEQLLNSGGYNSEENESRLLKKQFRGTGQGDTPEVGLGYDPVKELARNVGTTATFEFGDEIEAKVMSAIGKADYDTYVQELRQQQGEYRADKPVEAILTGIASGFLTGSMITKVPKVGKWLQANKDTSIAKRIIKLMGIGGTGGAVAGAGAYDPNRDTSLGGSMAMYGLGGALVPPLLIGGGQGIKAGATGLSNLSKNLGITKPNAQNEAIQRIANNLADQNITPIEVQRQLDEARRLGLNDIQIAELNKGTTKLGRQAATIQSESSEAIQETIDQSRQVFSENAQKRLNKAMGVEGDVVDSSYIFKINQNQYQEAKKLYPEAYKINVGRENFNVNKVDLFDQPLIKEAWETYVKKMKNLSLTGEANPTWDQLSKMKKIPTQYLHKIKMGLDDIIERNTDITGKVNAQGREVIQSKKLFDGITRNNNPIYKKANDNFSEAMDIKGAFNEGKKFFTKDTAELERRVQSMTEAQKSSFKSGVLNQMYEKIDKGQDVIRATFGTPRTRAALKLLFKSEKEFLDFEKMMTMQVKRKRAQGEILGGSQTARRQVEDALDSFSDNADKKGVIMSIVNKLKEGVGMNKEVAEELKKNLLLADPQRQKIMIQNLLKQYDQELAKTKMFDKIKQGTAGVGILSLPNSLETTLQF